ncbi:unnamed protein product [Rhizopus microsporus]
MNPVERRPSELKNKHKREALYQKQKLEKQKAKHKKRKERAKLEEKNPELKKKRLEENVPKTLDNTREADETMLDQPDDEVAQDEAMDELASYFSGKTPKILVTTSKKCSTNCYDFCAELVSMFPGSQFAKRGPKHELRQEFTDLIVVNEDRKIPNAITLIHLPDGPTAYFKLSSYVPSKAIVNHGKVTAHNPELILNNFNTRLGHTVGRMFQALLPQVPEFQGRQVITFHNQRDFIFVRRHRYVFRDTEKVGLQELGPRFTLKLRWLQKGVYQRDEEYEWIFKPELETSRKKFFL